MKWPLFGKRKTIFNLSIDNIGKYTNIRLKHTLEKLPKNANHLIFFNVSANLNLQDALSLTGILNDYKKSKGSLPIYTFGEDSVCGPKLLVFLSGNIAIAHEATIFGFYDFVYESNNFSTFKSNHKLEIEFLTSGINKVRLNPIEETKPEDVEWMKKILQLKKTILVNKIQELRPAVNMTDLSNTLGSRIISANEMKNLGLLDRFGTREEIRFSQFPNYKLNLKKNKMLQPLGIAHALYNLGNHHISVQQTIKNEIKQMLNGQNVIEFATSLNSPIFNIEI